MPRPGRILIISHEASDDRYRLGVARDRGIAKRRRRDGKREVGEWVEAIGEFWCRCGGFTCCCCLGTCPINEEEETSDER